MSTRWIVAGVFALTLGLPVAQAQSQSGSMSSPSAGTSSGGVPQAPIGHRQPTRADVGNADKNVSAEDIQDKKLDKMIRSICRGC